MGSPEAKGIAFSFEGLPEVIDSVAKLLEMIWEKSPILGGAAIILCMLLPFYIVYTWGTVRRSEKEIDKKIKDARKAHKKLKPASEDKLK